MNVGMKPPFAADMPRTLAARKGGERGLTHRGRPVRGVEGNEHGTDMVAPPTFIVPRARAGGRASPPRRPAPGGRRRSATRRAGPGPDRAPAGAPGDGRTSTRAGR